MPQCRKCHCCRVVSALSSRVSLISEVGALALASVKITSFSLVVFLAMAMICTSPQHSWAQADQGLLQSGANFRHKALGSDSSEYPDFPTVTAQASILWNYFTERTTIPEFNAETIFGLDEQSFKTLKVRLARAVVSKNLSWVQFERCEALSGRISRATMEVLNSMNYSVNADLSSYAHAFMITNWVRCHVSFDTRSDEVRRADETQILDREVPATVCGGSSWLCACLAAYSGRTKLIKVEGRLRGNGGSGKPDHSWNILKLPSGHVLFADVQHSRLSLSWAIQLNGNLNHPLCLAKSKYLQTLFCAYRYEMNEIVPRINADHSISAVISSLPSDPYSKLSITQWSGISTMYLDPVRIYRPNDNHEANWPH